MDKIIQDNILSIQRRLNELGFDKWQVDSWIELLESEAFSLLSMSCASERVNNYFRLLNSKIDAINNDVLLRERRFAGDGHINKVKKICTYNKLTLFLEQLVNEIKELHKTD